MKMFGLCTGLYRARALHMLLFTVLAGAVLVPVCGLADKGNLEPVVASDAEEDAPLYITMGKADLVSVPGDVSDVLVANPAIIDVKAVQSNRLYVVGLTVGDTNLIALDEAGNVIKKIDIHVKYDLKAIQDLVNNLFEGEDVKVASVHDQILLTGQASTPEKASKIANVVGHYVSDLTDSDDPIDQQISNLLDVRGEQQVMLKVKIIEASRSVLKELGIESNTNDPNELSPSRIFKDFPPTDTGGHSFATSLITGPGIALSKDPAGSLRFLRDTGVAGLGSLGVFLNALEEENLVNVLAEPNLTAVSGETAGFLAGGEFPVPVGRDNVGNLVIEFREFGVSLNFKPVVLSDKRISLNMNTEVSSLDFDSAIVLAQVTVPGLDVRRAETTVEIPSGGSLMIAGLLQSEAIKGMSGLPGINKAPVLGDLVKSDSFQRNETELVVIVTPYLVEPYADKKQAEKVPEHKSNPLATAFADNIRRAFGMEENDDLFTEGDQPYGYLLN